MRSMLNVIVQLVFDSSFVIPHSSLISDSVELSFELQRVLARAGGVLAALCVLEVLERGADLGALERAEVAAFDVAEAEVVVRVRVAGVGRRAEEPERFAAVRRPELDAALVGVGGRKLRGARGRGAGRRR